MPQAERIDAALLRRWPLPMPHGGGKDERGAVFVVAGAPQMPGAAILAATAALRAGAGKLRVATAGGIAAHVGAAVPEAFVVALDATPEGALAASGAEAIARDANAADAWLLGPGLVGEDASAAFACAAIARVRTPLVLDAAALCACTVDRALLHHLDGNAILTPHAGEMARLMGCEREAVEADPVRYAQEAARVLRAVVVMKGVTTYVAEPDGALYRNDDGSKGLGTSGSGDTLAGIVAGLLARGVPPAGAAAWGVHLHAAAGRVLEQRVGFGFLAREIAGEVPALMRAAQAPRVSARACRANGEADR